MTKNRQALLVKLLLLASLLHLGLLIISFVFSMTLPSFHEVAQESAIHCYWTDAMVPFVECGRDVSAGWLLDLISNYWTYLLYLLGTAIACWVQVALFIGSWQGSLSLGMSLLYAIGFTGLGLLFYAPFPFLIWRGYLHLRRHS